MKCPITNPRKRGPLRRPTSRTSAGWGETRCNRLKKETRIFNHGRVLPGKDKHQDKRTPATAPGCFCSECPIRRRSRRLCYLGDIVADRSEADGKHHLACHRRRPCRPGVACRAVPSTHY